MKQVLRAEDYCELHSNGIIHVYHAKNSPAAHRMLQLVQRAMHIHVKDYHQFSNRLHEILTNALLFLGIDYRLQLMHVLCSNYFILFYFLVVFFLLSNTYSTNNCTQ